MLILFLLCVLGIWLYLSYVSLFNKKELLLDCFEHVDIELKKRYALIIDIINYSQKFLESERSLVEYINKLREEVISLGLNQDYMNRRMALDKELENKSEQLITYIESNPSILSESVITEAIKAYREISDSVYLAKQEYNSAALEFRKVVDIFPTSLIARLNCIKSFDYMK